jgi:hypothetical protein
MQTRKEVVNGVTIVINDNPQEFNSAINDIAKNLQQEFQSGLTRLIATGINPMSSEAVLISDVDKKLSQLFNVEDKLLGRLVECVNEYSRIIKMTLETRLNQNAAVLVARDPMAFSPTFVKAHDSMSKVLQALGNLETLKLDTVPNDKMMVTLMGESIKSLELLSDPKVKQQANNILAKYKTFGLEIVRIQKHLAEEKKNMFKHKDNCFELDSSLVQLDQIYGAAGSKARAAASPNIQVAPAPPNRVAPSPPPSRPAPVAPSFMHSNQSSAQKAQDAKQRGQIYPAPEGPNAKK